MPRVKPSVQKWTCPHCGQFYEKIFVISTLSMYLYCYQKCRRYFTVDGLEVTADLGMLSEVRE